MIDNNKKERMLDLLTDEVLFGLDENERNELRELEELFPELKDDNSLELAVGAIGLTNLNVEPMPQNLQSKILVGADTYFAEKQSSNVIQFQSQLRDEKTEDISEEIQQTFEFEPKRPFMQWLGWAFAGLACIALSVSLWANFQKPQVIVQEVPQKVPTVDEQYKNLLSSAKDLKKTTWTNPTNDKQNYGEVVWSESEQKGFIKLNGLTANDVTKESYQLWIFDATQSDKTPIDGGVFDYANNGEVLIPIKANLKFKDPKMFAITAEKRGGVVVSPREKIVAIAKV